MTERDLAEVLQRHLPKISLSEASDYAENLEICLGVAGYSYQSKVLQKQPKEDIRHLDEAGKALRRVRKKLDSLGEIGREAFEEQMRALARSGRSVLPLGSLDPIADYDDISKSIRFLELVLTRTAKKVDPQKTQIGRTKHKNHAAEALADFCGDIYNRHTGRVPTRGNKAYSVYGVGFEGLLLDVFQTVGITANAEDQARSCAKRFREKYGTE